MVGEEQNKISICEDLTSPFCLHSNVEFRKLLISNKKSNQQRQEIYKMKSRYNYS